jgi:ATP synthase protein I
MGPNDPDPADTTGPFHDLAKRRERLSAELAKRTATTEDKPKKTAGWGEATKIASEFVAGIVVGVGLGLIFDRVFGTSPLGLIVCLMLGFAAGVLNVLRAQGVVADAGAKLRGKPPKTGGSADAVETDDHADKTE